MIDVIFPGRVGLQQRVVPSYRRTFLDTLAKACGGGLSVFAGKPLANEGIAPVEDLKIARLVYTKNKNFLDPSSPLYICWQNEFIMWLEDWQPEVLVVEANPRYPYTRKAIAWMHSKGRKVIGWGLGAPCISGPFADFRNRERLNLLRSLDAIVAYSSQGAEQYRKLGIPNEKVSVAFNAVELPPHQPPLKKPTEYDGKTSVLFVGRLQPRKRVDLLIKACAELPDTLQPKLTIVGDGPAREQLQILASQIYPNAEFVGAKFGSELESFFIKADLFVLPGTGGLAIQQAMAHGLPIIVAHGDGTQDDLVRDRKWLAGRTG